MHKQRISHASPALSRKFPRNEAGFGDTLHRNNVECLAVLTYDGDGKRNVDNVPVFRSNAMSESEVFAAGSVKAFPVPT